MTGPALWRQNRSRLDLRVSKGCSELTTLRKDAMMSLLRTDRNHLIIIKKKGRFREGTSGGLGSSLIPAFPLPNQSDHFGGLSPIPSAGVNVSNNILGRTGSRNFFNL